MHYHYTTPSSCFTFMAAEKRPFFLCNQQPQTLSIPLYLSKAFRKNATFSSEWHASFYTVIDEYINLNTAHALQLLYTSLLTVIYDIICLIQLVPSRICIPLSTLIFTNSLASLHLLASLQSLFIYAFLIIHNQYTFITDQNMVERIILFVFML